MEFAPVAWVQKLLATSLEAQTELTVGSDRTRSGLRFVRLLRARLPLALVLITLLFVTGALADPGPRLEIEGMTFVASRENNDAVILHAKHARFDTKAKKAYLRGVDAQIPGTPDQRGFRMRCDTGVVDLESNDFEVTGNVTGEADSGEYFEAEWVRYDHEKGVFFTDVPVMITHRGTTFRGGGFSYDISKRRFHLLGGAQVVQDVNDLKKGIGR